MNLLDGYGMDTITMAGPLEAKLEAMKSVGFSQVMLMARDLVGHPGGVKAAVKAIQNSGLRPTGFQVLRDFEGLSGHLHNYKVDIAKSMLEMCAATGSKVLAWHVPRHPVMPQRTWIRSPRILKSLAMMAIPLGIKVAYEGLSWGRTVNEFTTSWDVVCRADCPNLGIGIDSFHIFAAKTPLDAIEDLDP
jgi:sugar phosphate isomerase/epimerase